MSDIWPVPIEGGCGCSALRYRLERSPIFVHCCNCRQCQRETGSAFVLNAMVEDDKVTLVPGNDGEVTQPKCFLMPSESGLGQVIARCPRCYVAVWSFYPGAGPFVKFVRAGTLDKNGIDGRSLEDVLQPDIFIFTDFKQSWVIYPEHAKASGLVMAEFYNPAEKWPKEAFDRFQELKPRVEEWKKQGSRWQDFLPALQDCR